jgi:hypothetical protein
MFQIRYDPACLKPINAASAVSGMNALSLLEIAEELWTNQFGKPHSIHQAQWPKVDEATAKKTCSKSQCGSIASQNFWAGNLLHVFGTILIDNRPAV